MLGRVVREAGVITPTSPHTLRRTVCAAGLITGVPLWDMQFAMRHPDAEPPSATTWAEPTPDRHAAPSVAAYVAGMAIG